MPPLPTAPSGMTPSQFMTEFGSQSGTSQQNQQVQQQTQNQYNPAAQQLQTDVATTLSQMLRTGQLPGDFGVSQQPFDALRSAFNRGPAHMLAAQFGAGSAQIPSQWALMQEQLAADLGRQQWGNIMSLFSQAQPAAYTATGVQSSGTTGQTGETENEYQRVMTDNYAAGLLASLMAFMR